MKIQVNGVTIDYRDEGAGLPCIFIHAFPLNQTMWDEQVKALKNHCRAITLDLRGFGGSDATKGLCSMSQMASDIRQLMKILSIDRAALVGMSMGGYIALAFYRDYPEMVRAMVLANTRAAADTTEARERRMKSAERAERYGAAAIADDMISIAFTPATAESRPRLIERLRAMIEANSPPSLAAAQRGMAARLDSTELLSSIDFPVVIIAGSDDRITPLAEMKGLHDRIPASRLTVIEGVGHFSNLERADEFNQALIDFIQSLPDES
ncbi:MAG TPA: alpha/beta hydrolase [Blastocatellia bacterium]|jgi:pimeloyl-ACP methyl ester carboxylesterase